MLARMLITVNNHGKQPRVYVPAVPLRRGYETSLFPCL